MRSQRACEVLLAEGYSSLINMVGGVSGGPNAEGTATQPGWSDCGHPLTTEPQPERTWAALQPEAN